MHDLVHDDLSFLYPSLIPLVNITVYDVAPTILSMFDKSLANYALRTFAREGIRVKTEHHILELRAGFPGNAQGETEKMSEEGFTLTTKEDGEVGIGMCVWSTGMFFAIFPL